MPPSPGAWDPVGTYNQLFLLFHCRYKLCEQRGNCAASFAYVCWCGIGDSYLILLKKVCYTFFLKMFDPHQTI